MIEKNRTVKSLNWLLMLFVIIIFCQPAALQAKKLIVATKSAPPFAVKNNLGQWGGISIELWTSIANELDLDYEFREMSLKDMLRGLEEGTVDVAAAALTVTAEREEHFDFTHAFYTSGLGIAVVKDTKAGWLTVVERFISPTFLKVILALTAVLFAAGFFTWLFERKSNHEQFGDNRSRGLGSAFWWAAVTMTTVGYGDKVPKTLGGRCVGLIWMFTSIIIISGFTASITSALTVGQLQVGINGPDDLKKVTTATVKGSTSQKYLVEKGLRYTSYGSIEEALDAVKTGQAAAIVYDAPILRYMVKQQNDGDLHVLRNVFKTQYYAFGLAEKSSLREPVNRKIVEQINSSTWQKMLTMYLGQR
jgi:ABC-type amino acid transport substrate-binding protein